MAKAQWEKLRDAEHDRGRWVLVLRPMVWVMVSQNRRREFFITVFERKYAAPEMTRSLDEAKRFAEAELRRLLTEALERLPE